MRTSKRRYYVADSQDKSKPGSDVQLDNNFAPYRVVPSDPTSRS